MCCGQGVVVTFNPSLKILFKLENKLLGQPVGKKQGRIVINSLSATMLSAVLRQR